MARDSVWVKLVIDGDDSKAPTVFATDLTPHMNHVDHLTKAIAEEADQRFDEKIHSLVVYPPKTPVPMPEDATPLRPDLLLSDLFTKNITTFDNPLIVTVKSRKPQHHQQEMIRRLPSIEEGQVHELPGTDSRMLLEEIQELRRAVVKQDQDRATPQKSAASLGKDEHARLFRLGRVKMFTPIETEGSILSVEEAELLAELTTERQIVAFLTPHLESIFKENDDSTTVVVNSEAYKWLQTSEDTTYNQNPDLFVCHKSIYRTCQPYKTTDLKSLSMRLDTNIYGVLAKWKLRRFLYLVCKAKLHIDNGGFGEVINYGAHICFNEDGPVTVRLILFDKKELWLVECVKGAASFIEKCKWVDGGSCSLVQEFALHDPVMDVLDEACKCFGLSVENDSFLGQGAFGIVFRVKNIQGRVLALKIVLDENKNVRELTKQKELTEKAKEKCPDFVVGIEDDGYRYFEDKAAAVLLQSDAGGHYLELKPNEIIDSLMALHNENILHGDCRVENVVSVEGKPRWIDFRQALLFPVADVSLHKSKEMSELRQSIARVFYG